MRIQFDGFDEVPCHSSLKRIMAVGTFIILIICKFTTGLRVTDAQEAEGLDTTLHGEALEH